MKRPRSNSIGKTIRPAHGARSLPRARQPRRYRLLFCEALEPRRLLAADTHTETELIDWDGQSVQVHRGEWILQLPGQRNNPNGLKLGPLVRSLNVDNPAILNAVGRQISPDGDYWFDFGESVSANAAAAVLSQVPGLKRFEPNYVVSIDVTPNDPNYSLLWGLNQATDVDIDAPEAWDITTGSTSVVVGVIDTGIDYGHEDLRPNIWTNPVECPAGVGNCSTDGIDNDSNGYIDDFYGWDFANNDNDPFDDHSHGTHVAGTIAAAGNNSKGVTGVSWNSKLMALKFIGSGGTGSTANAIAAIQYATKMKRDHGINVVITNNSWGGAGYSQALYDAISASGAQNILFVGAAGNNSSNNDVTPHYPSSYNLNNIIATASITSTDALSSFSNTGVTSVDLGAPGSSIYSAVPAQGYSYKSGTSMAAPHVAGVAALAWSLDATATYTEIRDAILNSVQPIPALQGVTASGGRLNAYATLEYMGLFATLVSPAEDSIVGTAPTTFTIDYSDSIVSSSVQPADLLVNGISATSANVIDANTVQFQYASSPVTVEGLQQVAVPAGSVLRLGDNDGVAGLQRTFYFDPTPLVVSAITPPGGSVLTLPDPVIRIDFSEAIATGSIGLTDLTLSSGRIDRTTIIDSNTVEYKLEGIDNETPLQVTLPAGTVRDAFGIPNQAFSTSYITDNVVTAYPKPLAAIPALGSMLYESAFAGNIHAASDTDRFTLNLVAGQRISAILQPAAGLAGRLRLLAPSGSELFQVTGAAGSPVLMQSHLVGTTGSHTLSLEGNGTTTGLYNLQLIMNGAIEGELVTGSNNTQGAAENLDTASTAVGASSTRLGLWGSLASGTDIDWYQFSGVAAQEASVVVQSEAGVGLQVSLHNAGGTQIAAGSLVNGAYYIHDFIPPSSGNYFVQVKGVAGEYTVTVQRGAALDNNANDSLTGTQQLTGPTTLTGHVGRLPPTTTGSQRGEESPDLSAVPTTQLPNGFRLPSDMIEDAVIRDVDGVTQINFARPRDPRDWFPVAQSMGIEQADVSVISINSAPEGDLARDIVYTPDGTKYLVAYRDSRNVMVYNAATNAILATIPVDGEPESIAVSPNGQYAVTANTLGNSATVINLSTLTVTANIPLAAQWPYRVRITPDGNHAVLATADQAFSIVSLSTMREVRNIPSPGLGIYQAWVSVGKTFTIVLRYLDFLITPDSSSLLTGAMDESFQYSIRIHSLTSPSTPSTILSTTGMIHGLVLSTTGTKAFLSTAFVNPGKLYEVDVATKTISRTLTTAEFHAAEILASPDGQYLMGSGPNTLMFLRTSDGTTASTVGSGSVDDIALSYDGKYLLSRWVVDVQTRTMAASLPLYLFLDLVATSPTEYRGIQAAMLTSADFSLININGASSSVVGTLMPGSAPEGDSPIDIALTPDGLTAITANWRSDNVSVIDLATNTVTAWINVGNQPEDIVVTPNGTYALTTSAEDDSLSIIHLPTKTVVKTLTGFVADPRHIVISPDSATAYVNTTGTTNAQDILYFVSLNGAASAITGSLVMGDMAHELTRYTEMALSPDGSMLAVPVSRENEIALVNTATRTEVARLPTGARPMNAVFSPTGDQLYILNWFGNSVTFVQVAGANSVVTSTLTGLSNVEKFALDESGDYLYVMAESVVQVIDTASQSLVHTVSHGSAGGIDLRLVGHELYVVGGEPIPLDAPLVDDRGHLIRFYADGPDSRLIDDQVIPGYSEAIAYSTVFGSAYVPVSQDAVVVSNYDGDGNGDQDYYRFLPQVGDALAITATLPAITGGQIANGLQVGLELYGPNNQMLVRSLTGSLNHTVTMLGEYKLRVYGRHFSEGEYVLTLAGITEVAGPTILSVSPQLGATFVALDAPLVMTFDEPVVAGSGNISVRRYSDNVQVGNFSVTGSQVTVAGNTVTVVPGIVWDVATKHYVFVSAGALEDTSGNDFAGIGDKTLWNFTFGYGVDFGDAPSPYPVTPGENGPRHQLGDGPSLGSNRDPEFAGVHSALANGDDTTGAPDDEDGITFGTVRVGQNGATATVQVQGAPNGAKLDAWIDFNRDGLWGGTLEQIAFALSVENGSNTISFDVPSWTVDGTTFARFRLSTTGGLGTVGESLAGEVEDHVLTILPPVSSSDFFGSQNIAGTTTSNSRMIFAVDVDRDGDNDLLTVRGTNSQLAWYDNNGSGTFTERAIDSTMNSGFAVSAADVDGDGDRDVLAGALSGGLRWYENRGVLGFTRHLVDTTSAPYDVAGADMDRDGDVDLMILGYVNDVLSLARYENQGNMTFVRTVLATDLSAAQNMRLIDVDSDGDFDVVTNATGINWYENIGGALTKRSVTSNSSYAIDAMDFDGDGDVDVLAAAFDRIGWYRNDGNQNFTAFTISAANQAYAAVGADMDGDGDVDVISDPTDLSNNLVWHENDGSQNFTSRVISTQSPDNRSPLATDLDGDGDLDVVVSSATQVHWYQNQKGTSNLLELTLTASSMSENGGSVTGTIKRLAVADLSQPLVVSLSSSDTTEATVPATVTIAANQTTATFLITSVDDQLLDGTQPLGINATATGFFSTAAALDVLDYETLSLTVAVESIGEGAGSTTATVTRSNTSNLGAAQVVTLSNSAPTQATVPATVTIAAGQTTSSPFTINIINDTLLDGTQTVTVTASAEGYLSGADSFNVLDNESAPPSAVDLVAATDTGFSSSDDITQRDNSIVAKNLQFSVTGTISGATVRLYAGAVMIGSAVATGTTTTITSDGSTDLVDGQHVVVARQTQSGGQESATSASLTITIDTVSPSAPGAPDLSASSDNGPSNTDNVTNDATPTLNVAVGSNYFRLYRSTTLISGQWESGNSFTTAAQTDGVLNFSVSSVDAAGNESAASSALSVTLDTVAPTAMMTTISPDPRATSVTDAQVTFNETVGNFDNQSLALTLQSVSVPLTASQDPTSANGTLWTIPNLATKTISGGTYELRVLNTRLTDVAGNLLAAAVFDTWFRVGPPVMAAEPATTQGTTNTVSWGTVPGGVDYQVEYDTSNTFPSPDANSGWITSTSHTFSGLTAGQTYFYRSKSRLTIPAQSDSWSQTTRTEFEQGTLSSVATDTSPGDVQLFFNPTTVLFSETFEDNDISDWTQGSGNGASRVVTNGTAAAGAYSFTITGGSSDFNGISRSLNNLTPTRVDFYVRGAATNRVQSQVLLGTSTSNSGVAALFRMNSDGTMYVNGVSTAVAYNANQWYKISLLINWTNDRIAYYVDDVLKFSNINFLSTSNGGNVNQLSLIHLYDASNAGQSWWDEITMSGPGQYVSAGTITSPLISPSANYGWQTLQFNKTTPANTTLTVDVLNSAGAVLASNVAHGASLASLPLVPIKLRANLATTLVTATPTLHDWAVSYTSVAESQLISEYSNIVSSTQDATAPSLVSTVPANAATNVAPSANLSMTFNESVQAGTGSILIRRSSDNATVATINVTSSSVTFSGTTVTIDPPAALDWQTQYYVQVPNGAIKDLAGNDYAGFSGSNVWQFTTAALVIAKISDVIVSSTAWSSVGFLDAVDGGGIGTGNLLGHSLVGGHQLRNIPWIGINKIYIRFTGDVSASFCADAVSLVGTNVANYKPFANVQYGVDGANVVTITLTNPIIRDALVLSVFDYVVNSSGNRLDGEWIDGAGSISGDGVPGGQFNFRIDVLPGDVNDSNGVNLSGDVLAVYAKNDTVTQSLADAYFDVNGSGGVNLSGDVLAVFDRNDTVLPGAPSAPSPSGGCNGGGSFAGNSLEGEFSEGYTAKVDAIMDNWGLGPPVISVYSGVSTGDTDKTNQDQNNSSPALANSDKDSYDTVAASPLSPSSAGDIPDIESESPESDSGSLVDMTIDSEFFDTFTDPEDL